MEIRKDLKILVVDDNPSGRDLVEIVLINFSGLEPENVFKAENGRAAFEIIKKEKINLVISDYQMPVMDGLELFRLVKEDSNNIYFLLVSGVCGRQREEVRGKMEQSLGSGFLERPFGAEELIAKISSL